MKKAIAMPNLGYDMEAGKIASWLVAVGDDVSRGQPIAEIETDKTTVEMESLHTGTVVEIVHGDGVEVDVGQVIGYLEVAE
ncbi:MAG: biotin/lipoyl-binding protein [Actinobacteria bacterium]|nr:biotin/lipoyl-binding protein [Actinomycetota bacterium]